MRLFDILGVNFHDTTVFDSKMVLSDFKTKLDRLASSQLLQPYQKFTVLNTFICPTLHYKFQTTPLNYIPAKYLSDADILTRTRLKDLLQLSMYTPASMLYSAK